MTDIDETEAINQQFTEWHKDNLAATPRQIYFAGYAAAPKGLMPADPERVKRLLGEHTRCPYCDDSGDVHTIDGEWRGTCDCPAGQNKEPS